MNDDQVREMLERLGQALSEGDAKTVASCWEVPAMVLSDQGATAVAAMAEIELFFDSSIQDYRSRGTVATRPVVGRIQPLSEKVSAVEVSWPSLDSTGTERGIESSYYIVRLGDDGRPYIRVALTRTV